MKSVSETDPHDTPSGKHISLSKGERLEWRPGLLRFTVFSMYSKRCTECEFSACMEYG